MTGPEHYAEAERLLALAQNGHRLDSAGLTAEAAVHAALADTSVLALAERNNLPVPDRQAWQVVASEAFADGRCPVCSRKGDDPCVDPTKGEPLEFWHRARRRGEELRDEHVTDTDTVPSDGPTAEEHEKCECRQAGIWGATGKMPANHHWHWRNTAHTSGYLAHGDPDS